MQEIHYMALPYSYCAFQVAAGLVAQGMGAEERKEWWARVWLMCWWIGVEILCCVYRGLLVAVLTIPAFPSILHTVQEVASSEFMYVSYNHFIHYKTLQKNCLT